MIGRLGRIVVAASAIAAASATARANPADVLGFGSRSAALGGAGVALAEDSSANYYNPAGLVRGRDLRIDLGYQGGLPSLRLNGKSSGVDATHGFVVGVAAPGRIGPLRLAFGAALFLPDDRLTRVRALAFAQPRWMYYDNRTQRIFLAASLAVQIVPGLYVGLGLAFMSRTRGTVDLQGTIAVNDTNENSALTTQIDVDLTAVRYPQAGIWWDATGWLTVAASYRHSFSLQLDQGFAIRGNVGDPGFPPLVEGGYFSARVTAADLFQPAQLTVGAAARLTRRLRVVFDAVWARWSEFQPPASTIAVQLEIGPKLDPLVHLPAPRSYPEPGFHDLLIPRLGVEWRALERPRIALDLRCGYSYEASPAPEQIGESNYADADKHRFSIGAGWEALPFPHVMPRPIGLDAHFALTVLPARQNRKADPSDPVGDFTAEGRIFEVGVTTRWRF